MHTFIRTLRCAALVLAPLTAAHAQDVHIPLVQGLTTVGSHHAPDHDFERVTRVDGVTSDDISTLHRLQMVAAAGTAPARWAAKTRIALRTDLASAHTLNECYAHTDPETLPGTTDFQASAALLAALKSPGKAAFVLVAPSKGTGVEAAISDHVTCQPFTGTLKRVGTADEPFALLVNGRRVQVQALHAKGYLETAGGDGEHFDFWFLDDAANPLWLKAVGDEDTNYQVVRVDFPDAVAPLADLAGKSCRAELHGVYFETGSAALLPESNAALLQAAAVMKAHPAWRMTVEGHTDNLGGAAPNLELSNRRATAVRDVLVTHDGVPATQLATQGFGLTKPVETNDTAEGRARNRRVELARQCP